MVVELTVSHLRLSPRASLCSTKLSADGVSRCGHRGWGVTAFFAFAAFPIPMTGWVRSRAFFTGTFVLPTSN